MMQEAEKVWRNWNSIMWTVIKWARPVRKTRTLNGPSDHGRLRPQLKR